MRIRIVQFELFDLAIFLVFLILSLCIFIFFLQPEMLEIDDLRFMSISLTKPFGFNVILRTFYAET